MKETGLATKKSNRPGFYAKQGLVVLKMRMSLDQRSIYIYVAIYSYSPAPFGSLEAENVLGPTIYIYIFVALCRPASPPTSGKQGFFEGTGWDCGEN